MKTDQKNEQNPTANEQLRAGQAATGQAPRLRFYFEKAADPEDYFTPLAPPSRVKLSPTAVNGDLLDFVHTELALTLRAGTYSLPVVRKAPLQVTIPASCKTRFRITAHRGLNDEGESEKSIVTGSEITFAPALELPNVWRVLAGLPTLFKDHDIEAVRAQIQRLRKSETARNVEKITREWVNWLSDSLELMAPEAQGWSEEVSTVVGAIRSGAHHIRRELEAGARRIKQELSGGQRLPTVRLEKISARPIHTRRGWELELRFSGTLIYPGATVQRFNDVALPRSVLPAPHALLEHLLSETPLSTARLEPQAFDTHGMLAALAELLGAVDGHFELRGKPPLIEIISPTPAEGRLAAELSFANEIHIQGDLHGRFTPESLEMSIGDLQIGDRNKSITANLEATIATRAPHPFPDNPQHNEQTAPRPVARQCVDAAFDGAWPHEALALTAQVALAKDSGLQRLGLSLQWGHPLARGTTRLVLAVEPLEISGQFRLQTGRQPQSITWEHTELDFSCNLEMTRDSIITDGNATLAPTLTHGTLCGRAQSTLAGGVDVSAEGRWDLALTGSTPIKAFPELDIIGGVLKIDGAGAMEFAARSCLTTPKGNLLEMDFKGTQAHIALDHLWLDLPPRTLRLPPRSHFQVRILEGVLATSGLGRANVEMSWDLHGQSPLLQKKEQSVALFVEALRAGSFCIALSQVGGVSISGKKKGLYDAHFFNALVNPGAEPKRWLEILDSDEAMERVLAALRLFTAEGAAALDRLRRFAQNVRIQLEAENIEQPRDLIPATRIARLISRVLTSTADLEARIYPLVKQVVDGNGLDVPAVRKLLQDTLGEHEYTFEVDRGLRILARALAPTAPLEPMNPTTEVPLTADPQFAAFLAQLPSAGEIYETVSGKAPVGPVFARRLMRIAPYLTLEQLDWILARQRRDWQDSDRRLLKTIRFLKRRVRLISESYGGIAFVPQAWAISLFLGEATRPRFLSPPAKPSAKTSDAHALAQGLLGPEETAVLLQAGLASFWQGESVQINQKLLLDYICRQPPSFLTAVLVEMAAGSTRALTGVLYALVQMEQDSLRDPVDMITLISERTGVTIPRLSDYMAGGRWARKSHYAAMTVAAQHIIEKGQTHQAVKEHLQTHRDPPLCRPVATLPRPDIDALVHRAQQAIAAADRQGARCTFKGNEPRRRERARKAYEKAFAQCRALLAADPTAIWCDWLKNFWARNHEALTVLSVVRNHQKGIDQVPRWLKTRLGHKPPTHEGPLVEAVIDVLYFHAHDRARLKADPLIRLLIDPPAGEYDFTVISCMGVITEGAAGTELCDAYARLEEQRAIKVIRADTKTARSLHFNAARVEDAVRSVDTPWGYIGYSQGCANGLQAESRLLGGTPEQQSFCKNLRCRNLLFSAINGSAHGTCGDQKFLRVMSDGDRFIKHYQALLSKPAIEFGLKNIRQLLDSRLFVHSLAGVHSLSHEGVRPLARDGQFKPDVPTSIVRGIVERDTLPEALEMLSNVLTKQIESTEHDTQVTTWEAVGHPVWVRSPQAAVLEKCDMGGLVQRTHHWSPLYYTADFITTERDIAQAVYMFPKDRHVFPWIEVNARFGIIPRKSSKSEQVGG